MKRWKMLLLALVLLTLPLAAGCGKDSGAMAVYGVNTGKSDCLVFSLPNGETMLVDTGLKETYGQVKAILDQAGIKKIDHIVITHGHNDHIGGLKKLAQDFEIGTIYTNAYDKATYNDKERALLSSACKNWSRISPATETAGGRDYASLQIGGVKVDFLSPARPYSDEEDDNNNSLVLRLAHGSVTFLLMGDATSLIEEDLLAWSGGSTELSATFLKAGRHGKDDANLPAFIEAVSPKTVYLTGSRADDADSPSGAVVKLYEDIGADIYINEGDHLAVRWTSDGESLSQGEYLS